MAHGKQQITGEMRKKPLKLVLPDEEIKQSDEWELGGIDLSILTSYSLEDEDPITGEMRKKLLKLLLPDEEIKQSDELDLEGIELSIWSSFSLEDEEKFYRNQTLSEAVASAVGVSVSELEQSLPCDDEGCEIDDPYVPPLPELPLTLTLADPFGGSGIIGSEFLLNNIPEYKFNGDFALDKDKIFDEVRERCCALQAELKSFCK